MSSASGAPLLTSSTSEAPGDDDPPVPADDAIGPQSGSTSTNMPRGIEQCVNWTTDLQSYMRGNGHTSVVPTEEAEADWTAQVVETYSGLPMTGVRSWFIGFNTNVDGSDRPRYLL